MSVSVDNIDITKLLPHRAPMLMVDEIIELSEEFVQSEFRVVEECIFYDDKAHTLSAEGLVENMAQTASIIIGQSYIDPTTENNADVIGFISSIKKLGIIGDLPNLKDKVVTSAKIVSRMDGEGYTLCTVEGEIAIKENKVLNCTLNLFIKSLKNEGE